MRKPKRIVHIFWRLFSLILFLVIATILVASAHGYMFNQRTLRFEQTGTINVTTKQVPVTITLNGRPKVYKKSPINLWYLLPDRYDVLVTKDSYFPWHQVIDLHTSEVVVNPFVKLFLENAEPVFATESEVAVVNAQSLVVPDEDLDVRLNEIWVKPLTRTYPVQVASDSFSLISRFSSPVYRAIWLPGKTHIIFQVGKEIRICDRDGTNDHTLATLDQDEATLFITDSDGKVLLYKNGDQVYRRQLQ